jgi:hypothetical protein
MNKIFFLIVLNLISINSYSISDDANYGKYGFFWFTQGYYPDSSFYGSTADDAAMILCNKTQDCVDMVFDSEFVGQWVKYKKKFSNGGLSIVTTSINKSECDATSNLIPSCQVGYGQSSEICEDGFPSDILGYEDHCDRVDLQQCSDGSYITINDTCPQQPLCSDSSSCYAYLIQTTGGCADGEEEIYEYQDDPQIYSLTCNQTNDPDPDPDPNTDPSDIDIDRLATLIDDALEDDFSSVEQAIRDDTEQSISNTTTIESAIDNIGPNTSDLDTTSLESTINSASTSIANNLGAKLDSINQSLNSGECDPKSANYYDCLNNSGTGSFPSHSSTGGASSIDEAFINFKGRIENSELISSFSGMSQLIDVSNSQCPQLSIDLRDTIVNKVATTTLHCELMESIKPFLTSLMMVIYIWAGFRVFASA